MATQKERVTGSRTAGNGAVRSERLAAIVADVGAAGDLEEALRALASGARNLLSGGGALVHLYAGTPPARRCALRVGVGAAAGGPHARRADADCELEPGTVAAHIADGGTPVLVADAVALEGGPLRDDLLRAGSRSALGVPIEAANRRIGGLHVSHAAPGAFGAADLELAASLARLAGGAIERLRRDRRERERERERAQRLAAVVAAVGAATETEAAMRALLAGAVDLLESESGIARLYAPGTDRCVMHLYQRRGRPVERRPDASVPLPGSFTARLLAGEPAALVEDYAALDPQAYPVAPLVLARGGRSALHVPIEAAGRRIGTLSLDHDRPGFFGGRDLGVAVALAARAGAAVERARMEEERRRGAERHVARLRALNEFARAVDATLDLDAVCAVAVERIAHLTGAARCVVLQHVPPVGDAGDEAASGEASGDAGEPQFRYRAVWHAGQPQAPVGRTAPFPARLAGAVHRTQSPCVVRDTRAPEAGAMREAMRDRAGGGILSAIAVPITAASAPWGVLNTGFAAPLESEAEANERTELLVSFASTLAAAVRNAGLFSELRAAHEELRAAQGRVVQQERLRALGEMASGVAHDLNNALAPVVGFSELLLADQGALADPGTIRHYLGLIHAGARDAASVVARLREFYRSRGAHEALREVDLQPLVEQVVSLTQPKWRDQALAEGRTIRVETDLGGAAPVEGSEAELRELLTNLIFNAVDAMPDGGTIAIRARGGEAAGPGGAGAAPLPLPPRVSASGAARWVAIEVADTGTGMTEEVRQRCLEPFFSTKGERGTGLGLPMVYGSVQRHGGELEIESAPGRGTTFRIWLPRAGAAAPAAPAAPAAAPAAGAVRRILVVDDDPGVRAVTVACLEADGHAVAEAASGEAALAALEAGPVDLLVTDRAMPGMSGDQLAAAARRVRPGLPVILLTGFGNLMETTGEIPDGVDAVVGKPATRSSLRAAVARVSRSAAARGPRERA